MLAELIRSNNDERVRDTTAQALLERGWAKAKRCMFRGNANTVFHVCDHSAAAALAKDLVMSGVFVANSLGHAILSNTARYAHSKPHALLDIASRT